ncbi:MAG: paraquat-inducible protein A [Neisseria sp.]|nr:paraquat-inducible protein A [Neisseria sp.]
MFAKIRSVLTLSRSRRRKYLLPDATLSARRLGCGVCGARVDVPRVRQGQEACCPRCGANLVRVEREPYVLPIVYALTALAVLLVVSFGFFMGMTMPGVAVHLTLPGMMAALVRHEYGFLANVMFVFVFATPLLFLLLVLYVYAALLRREARPWLLQAARWMFRLRVWLMVDIFAVSALVALVKIRALAQVEYGVSFYAMFVYSLLLARVVLAVPPHWVYEQIARLLPEMRLSQAGGATVACRHCHFEQPQEGVRCTVCGARLSFRRAHSLRLAWAFLLTAMILYVPANTLPMMITENPMVTFTSKIVDGVFTLWQGGDHLVAVIIFIASVAIPLLKIIGMMVVLIAVRFRLPFSARTLTRLYHTVEMVGRWSMIDVFVTIMLMATFATPLARVLPGVAVIYFTLVVILTMLSAYFFDVRLLWDKQREDDSS